MSLLSRIKPLSAAIALSLSLPALAADHPLTANNYDDGANVNVLDLVLSVDWNVEAPPSGLGQDFLREVLAQTARSVYMMTEGRLAIGRVSVYGNSQFKDNTDLIISSQPGRASADLNGFLNNCRTCNALNFVESTPQELGRTIAHELGHYALGLYDEYREEGKTQADDPGTPLDGDTPRNTIMNDHTVFNGLSLPSDYAKTEEQRTAHFRKYAKSAWEVLVQDPGQDLADPGRRISFQALRGRELPGQLTLPSNGGEARLNVVFMGGADQQPARAGEREAVQSGPMNVLLINQAASAEELEAIKAAAMRAVESAGSNARIAVVPYPYSASGGIGLTAVGSESGRQAVKQAISAIRSTADADLQVRANWIFDAAPNVYPSLFSPAGGSSQEGYGYYYRYFPGSNRYLGTRDGHLWYYDPTQGGPETPAAMLDVGPVDQVLPQAAVSAGQALQKALGIIGVARQSGDTPAITLFGNPSTALDQASVAQAVSQKVALNPISLNAATPARARAERFSTVKAGGQYGLPEAANLTHGQFAQVNHLSELDAAAARAINAAEGDNTQVIADAYAGNLAAGTAFSRTVVVSALDGGVEFSAYWGPEDDNRVSFSLRAPDGSSITPTALPAGVTYEADLAEGIATYTVAKEFGQRVGSWTGTITANQATDEGVDLEVVTASTLALTADDTHGVLVASLRGPVPVKGASVVADIFDASGSVVAREVALRDDGQAPDTRANDGSYSYALAGLAAGDYEVEVRASNPNGKAAFSTDGRLVKGADQPDTPLPAFERTTITYISK